MKPSMFSKPKGYNFERKCGHGEERLVSLLVILNLLAFAMRNIYDIADDLWQAAGEKRGSRSHYFANLCRPHQLHHFPVWTDLLQTLACAKPPAVRPNGASNYRF
jgi:hypothetical protein